MGSAKDFWLILRSALLGSGEAARGNAGAHPGLAVRVRGLLKFATEKRNIAGAIDDVRRHHRLGSDLRPVVRGTVSKLVPTFDCNCVRNKIDRPSVNARCRLLDFHHV